MRVRKAWSLYILDQCGDRPATEERPKMIDLNVFTHRGITKGTSFPVGTLSKRLQPIPSLLLRVLIYVPDSHPFATNVLRACEFLLLLINLSSGVSEVIHDEAGIVPLENLLLLLLYAVIHCIVVVLEIVKFVHKTEK
jgi:hypothetical protein